ncbi:MAG: hypothetical protein HKL91_02735 [Candidatus Eremiobacteraeota bacterium]|uniref:Cell division protein FtsL n=1 Tax=mine drainage metagenome TaxID=410659 RepID=E6PIP5_9ZZZZ|nr:hypothetical protein [Candidatus Eremiobacteraeota bacterium]
MIVRLAQHPLVRSARRLAAIAVGSVFVLLVAAQFARVVGTDLKLASDLRQTHAQIATYERRDVRLRRRIVRLRTARGAIPEIHERLRMLAPNERMVIVEPRPSPAVH